MAWEPNNLDTAALAAIRWLAATLENLGTNIYLTDRSKNSQITAVLKGAVSDLNNLRVQTVVRECPPGYVECNGVCEPMCLGFEVQESSQTSGARRGAKRSTASSRKGR